VGTPPLLDSITYLILDDAARRPGAQNNAIRRHGDRLPRRVTIRRRTAGILDPARSRM